MITKVPDSWIPIDTFSYRGKNVKLYEDCLGKQLIGLWDHKVVELGYYNTTPQEDLKLLIDDQLDTVTRFENDPFWYGAKLEYFQNGTHEDLRLIYRGRVLNVFLDPPKRSDFSFTILQSFTDAAKQLLKPKIEQFQLERDSQNT